MGISAYLLERREGKGGSIEDGATRHGEVQRAAQRTRGKPRFPAAVTEVLQPSLSCVHGLRLQVFCRRHMSSNGLVCHARFGKSMARRFEDREDMTAGNSRRCRFTLAVSRRFSNSDGVRDTDFLPVVVWRTQAEHCNKYLKKGSKAAVSGSVQTRSYDAPDGSRRYVTEIVADEVQFLSTKAEDESASNDGVFDDLKAVDENLPF